ncbi:MAG: helix-turn-helix domain-containing protein [Bacteroidia bacterium]
MNLTERIRTIRQSKGLTQEQVAERMDISGSAFGQIERNAERATFATLTKIAAALEVSIEYLVQRGEE